MSYIHFKTVYNLNYDKVTFDGSSLTLQQLKKLIAEKSKLSKKLDFDLEISNADTNQIYHDNDLIMKNTRVNVKRVIKNSTAPLRQKSPTPPIPTKTSTVTPTILPSTSLDLLTPNKNIPLGTSKSLSNINEPSQIGLAKTAFDSLAPLSIPSKPLVYVEEHNKTELTETEARLDEKAKLESILMSSMNKSPSTETQSRFIGFSKSWQKQTNPLNRPIPPGYLCVICKKPGHLKQLCPEAGSMPKPEERPKFPSGIPRTNLRPAQAGDKFAMLGPEGYVITEIDQKAAQIVKKDRILFEDEEEEGEHVSKIEEIKSEEIPKDLKCPFGEHLIKDAVLVPCCGNFICCDECIRQKIINEEQITCPNPTCDQEIGPLVSITPFHETRKKVQKYLTEIKTRQNQPQNETKTDVFFDLILNDIEAKTEKVETEEGLISPLQDNNISSSEILSQQLLAAHVESQRLSPALLTPPNTPSIDASQIRPYIQLANYAGYQYRARFYGPKPYPPQMYSPYMPRPQFYPRPRFIRPMGGYPEMGYYSSMGQSPTSVPSSYQNVMTESQFYEYQENLKKEKKIEHREEHTIRKRSRTRSRDRYRRSRSRSRQRDKYKSKNISRSRSRSRRKYRRSRSKTPDKKYKKRSRSRSRSRSLRSIKKKKSRSRSRDRKKSRSRSRTIRTTTSPESVISEKRKDKKSKSKSKKKKDKK